MRVCFGYTDSNVAELFNTLFEDVMEAMRQGGLPRRLPKPSFSQSDLDAINRFETHLTFDSPKRGMEGCFSHLFLSLLCCILQCAFGS